MSMRPHATPLCATGAPIPFTIKDIPVTIDVGTNHAQADVGNVLKELMGTHPNQTPRPTGWRRWWPCHGVQG